MRQMAIIVILFLVLTVIIFCSYLGICLTLRHFALVGGDSDLLFISFTVMWIIYIACLFPFYIKYGS